MQRADSVGLTESDSFWIFRLEPNLPKRRDSTQSMRTRLFDFGVDINFRLDFPLSPLYSNPFKPSKSRNPIEPIAFNTSSSSEDQPTTEDIPSVHSVYSTPSVSETPQPQPAQLSAQPSTSRPEQPASAASTPADLATMIQNLTTIALSNQMDLQIIREQCKRALNEIEQLSYSVDDLKVDINDIFREFFGLTYYTHHGEWPSGIPSRSAAPRDVPSTSTAPRAPLTTPTPRRTTPLSSRAPPAP